MGIRYCLTGAFLNAMCSVGTEATLKQTLKDEQNRLLEQNSTTLSSPPSKLLLSNAYSMWTSFFSFVLLIIPLLILGGRNADKSQTKTTCTSEDEQEDRSLSLVSMIGLCLVLLGVARFLERLSKHFICVCDSAMTFSVVQAARRLSGVYIIGILFGEHFSVGLLVGSLCSGTGFVLHAWVSMTRADSTIEREPHNYKKVASTMDLKVEDTSVQSNTRVEIELRQSLPQD